MVDATHSRFELRKLLRQRRNSLGPSQQRAAARALITTVAVLPGWTKAQHIALYLARDGEIDTGPLEATAREYGKQVYLPVLTDGDSLRFACWDRDGELTENRFGIPEPPEGAPYRAVSDLDIVFVPLVGWDSRCNRLGMGGGFYDRALSGEPATVLVGLAHDCQRVDDIPRESWDVTLDYIATDAALYRGRGAGEKAEVIRRK